MTWEPGRTHKVQPRVSLIPTPPGGTPTFSLTVGDTEKFVRVLVQLRMDEHLRRQESGAGAVTHDFTIAALHSLPANGLGHLAGRFATNGGKLVRAMQERQLAAVVEDPEGGYWGQSLVESPVDILSVEVCAPRMNQAMRFAHPWAGYAARTLLVTSRQASNVIALSEASLWGIGVTIANTDVRALEPEPYRAERWSPARWSMAEHLYAAVLSSGIEFPSAERGDTP